MADATPEPRPANGAADSVPGVRSVIRSAGQIDPGELALLLRAHQQLAWHAGEPVYVEAYLQELPGWSADDPEVLELIWCEILLREERGEHPALAEYEQRFPRYGQQLRRLAALQQALRPTGGRPQHTAVLSDEPMTLPPRGVFDNLRPGRDHEEAAPANLKPTVPGYLILGELGRGGMGVVYKARQISLGRLVALKMVLTGVHASSQQLMRFRLEAEAVARLQHPNIVPIYEIAEHQGSPYYSLEFAEGGSLARHLDGTPLPPLKAARFIETLARAVEAAHSQGIVHRDLKPGNVLLKQVQCSPSRLWHHADAEGGVLDQRSWTPKITDFGLAKQFQQKDSTGKTQAMTHSGAIVGTPCYMPPEQAGGRTEDLGPTADVYSLGAILYELLSGHPPFRAANPLDTLLQVISDDPVPLSRLQPGVPRDLDTICLKCLAKEPGQRYATAEMLADELHRFLSGRPILARPIPFWIRGMKWARRRPAAAWLIVLTILSSIGLVAGGIFYWEQRHANQLADEREYSARNRYFDQIAAADQAASFDEAGDALEGCPLVMRGWEWYYLRGKSRAAVMALGRAGGMSCAWRPGSDRLALGDVDRDRITFWDAASGQELGGVDHLGPAAAFSPDGKLLYSAESTGPADGAHAIVILDAQTNQETRRLTGHRGLVTALSVSRDGGRLASAGLDHRVRIWDLKSGKEQASLPNGPGWVHDVVFSPNGQLVASANSDGALAVWDLATQKSTLTLNPDHEAESPGNEPALDLWTQRLERTLSPARRLGRNARPVAISADGILAFARDTSITLWDIQAKKSIATLRGHTDSIRALAFGGDGSRLASAGQDRAVKIWDIGLGRLLMTLHGHGREVYGLAAADDRHRLASTGFDRTIIWDMTAGPSQALLGSGTPLSACAIDSEAEQVAVAGHRSMTYSVRSGRPIGRLPSAADDFTAAAFHPANEWLATGGADGIVRLLDPGKTRLMKEMPSLDAPIKAVAVEGKGQRLAAAGADGSVCVWDTQTGQQVGRDRQPGRHIAALAFSPDGHMLALAGEDGLLALWKVDAGEPMQPLNASVRDMTCVTFTSDGTHLAAGCLDGTIRYWDVGMRQEIRTIDTGRPGVISLAFQSGQDRLASGAVDGMVQLWEPKSGREILRLMGHVSPVLNIIFGQGGGRLVALGADSTAITWPAPNAQADIEANRKPAPASRSKVSGD